MCVCGGGGWSLIESCGILPFPRTGSSHKKNEKWSRAERCFSLLVHVLENLQPKLSLFQNNSGVNN